MLEPHIISAHEIDGLLREAALVKVLNCPALGKGVFWVKLEHVDFEALRVGDLAMDKNNTIKRLRLKTAACWVSHDRGGYEFERLFPEDYRGKVVKIYKVQ